MPPAEVTTDAEYVELAMTNGAGATAAVDLEELSVLAGMLCVGCEAGAAIGVLILVVTEEDSDWRGSAEGAESTCDVEVSVR